MSNHTETDSPKVRVPPPLIVAVIVAVGYGLDKILNTGLLTNRFWPGQVGAALVAIAFGVCVWTMLRYHRHKTNILPHSPDQKLISDGPFQFSRNPIYLAFLLAHIGFALILNRPLTLLLAVLSYFALRYYVIAREEAYLARQFGDSYLDYKRRVRRCI